MALVAFLGRPVHMRECDLAGIFEIRPVGARTAKSETIQDYLTVIPDYLPAVSAGDLATGRAGKVKFIEGNLNLLNPK